MGGRTTPSTDLLATLVGDSDGCCPGDELSLQRERGTKQPPREISGGAARCVARQLGPGEGRRRRCHAQRHCKLPVVKPGPRPQAEGRPGAAGRRVVVIVPRALRRGGGEGGSALLRCTVEGENPGTEGAAGAGWARTGTAAGPDRRRGERPVPERSDVSKSMTLGSPLRTLLELASVRRPKVKPVDEAGAVAPGLKVPGPGDPGLTGSMALGPHFRPNRIPTAPGDDSIVLGGE